MLDFRILTFLTVCETMHFTRAAELLHITQPAVSHQIHALEEQYGAALFSYEGKKLLLTDAGKLLRETALTMRHDADLLKARIKHLCNGQSSLSFGATLTVGEFAMPSLLAQYLQNHPKVQIQMQVADTEQLLAKLDRGEIDFAIVEGAFPRNSYECLLFTKERFVPVCGRHYVFQHSVHTIQDLLGERLLVRESGSGTRHILEHYLESYNLSIQDFALQAEISNIAALKNLAAFNCGITFLYQVAAWEELAAGILREIPLENFDIQHDFSFIWRKNSCYGEDYKKVFEEFHRLFVGNTQTVRE